MSTADNPAAALGRLRWKGVSKKKRSDAMRELALQGAASMTPEARVARAKKASEAAAKARKRAAKKKPRNSSRRKSKPE